MSVLEDVRRRLAAERRAGVPFEEAWARATAGAPPSWAAALEATRATWQAAYTGGATTSGEHAATMMVAVRAIAEMRDDGTATAERRRPRPPRYELIA